ncbi:MAG: methylenetetrahydrofolate--tRNA-(uracil(54)-C(5))-methyltransferase (FADH(2)-oxidizing) TrmFO [Clostridiaceae bacterium]|nr:methylenetetrahydrofolate--tRNA-(uracil(54)-C(5))-methyltransferase (FADH(2)-oxidizing) TrmFO [Clostridiaceae bacterium]
MKKVNIIGAGLAGSEAAYQIAEAGIPVVLYEMKPDKYSPAHKIPYFAELVCSNSLRSNLLENAVGVLKQELRYQNSLIIAVADKHQIPAGGALAVDRTEFSRTITNIINEHPLITVEHKEVKDLAKFDLENEYVLIASGPLTSDNLYKSLKNFLGEDLYFFDAVAPIIEYESIDHSRTFKASRYGKGIGEYINCPFNKEQYELFYQALLAAKTVPINELDEFNLFQGCMPIEEIARQGPNTLLFGPLKPIGLNDPTTGKEPYAVVQLRQDNQAATLYNLVGFQTRLTWSEQKRVFRMIPGLENAIFERFGVMHRNIYYNSPNNLKLGYQHKTINNLFFAGQITGVEGYVESVGSGLVAAKTLIRDYFSIQDENTTYLNPETILGGLAHYVTSAESKYFQPMNANFGLVPALTATERNQLKQKYNISEKGRRGRRLVYARRALSHYPQFHLNIS